ncbi:MAG: hypothetical protein G3M78_00105 [Candidatus Nitrohelix vancouverensis]|uniref:Secreted protein n=1 Tax=Candidatus Nitrohelix vancouverensis TaxID=2705534 RepID=A0A7T0BZP0_9BACT|nr:MAG: hypothetical protein G3M78_00105 [Candidatus Nitrohelix vancouverensis]
MKRTTRNSIAALSIIALLAFASAVSAVEPEAPTDEQKAAIIAQSDQNRDVVEEQQQVVADQVREDRSTPEFIQGN